MAWFYRRLEEKLDLIFLCKATKQRYGSTGNPSIDPVVFRTGGPVLVHAYRLFGEPFFGQETDPALFYAAATAYRWIYCISWAETSMSRFHGILP